MGESLRRAMDVFSFPDAWGEIADSIAKGYGSQKSDVRSFVARRLRPRIMLAAHLAPIGNPRSRFLSVETASSYSSGYDRNIAQYRSEDIRSGWAVRLIRNGFYRTIRVDDANIVIQYL